ncbi:MAG: hypothetical protein ACLPWD_03980 [Methanobacterium sp.]
MLIYGEPQTDYTILLTGMFVASTWTLATTLSVLILQNRIII